MAKKSESLEIPKFPGLTDLEPLLSEESLAKKPGFMSSFFGKFKKKAPEPPRVEPPALELKPEKPATEPKEKKPEVKKPEVKKPAAQKPVIALAKLPQVDNSNLEKDLKKINQELERLNQELARTK